MRATEILGDGGTCGVLGEPPPHHERRSSKSPAIAGRQWKKVVDATAGTISRARSIPTPKCLSSGKPWPPRNCRAPVENTLLQDDHYERGYHPTATSYHCLVASLGNDAVHRERRARYQVGNAAKNGLVAASFAREGFVGATHPIEGKYGFLNAYAPSKESRRGDRLRLGDHEYRCEALYAISS